jgi:hypothetical protein
MGASQHALTLIRQARTQIPPQDAEGAVEASAVEESRYGSGLLGAKNRG